MKPELQAKFDEMQVVIDSMNQRINELEESLKKSTEKKGPKSVREMVDDDARRILIGDLADKSHKTCAETLGLSYAQVYSCRKEFTFKHIHAEIEKAN